VDDEYVRNGAAELFMELEPLAGRQHVAATERRTRRDWAVQIKQILDERYLDAVKIRLVMDNLNTQSMASLYEEFDPLDLNSTQKAIPSSLLEKVHGFML
jgi:hypothetical protein